MPSIRVMSGIAIGIILVVVALGVVLRGAIGNGRTAGKRSVQVDVPPVQVMVTKLTPQAGRYVFRYTIVNGSAFPITNVLIGTDYDGGAHELTYAPIGWDSATVYKSPPGWDFRVVTSEEDTLGHIQWDISRTGEEILGGGTLGGFEVTLDEVDQAYEHGHWTVYLNTTEEPLYTGWLQPSGVTSVPASSVFGQSDLRIKPNPAKEPVGIQFAVPVSGVATVDVFDTQGRLVKRVLNKTTAAGNASTSWDGRDTAGKEVAAGVYFVRVKTPTTLRFARITWLH